MTSHGHHAYHLVDMSTWPLTGSISAMMLTTGLVKWFHQFNMDLLCLGLVATILNMVQWWRDITREGTYQGLHTGAVVKGLRWGMILFIASEVFFFFSFFWAFFHSSLSPAVEIGIVWPPLWVQPFNPFQIPLLNTMILLSSGATVTWAHHAMMESNQSQTVQCFIGILFYLFTGFWVCGGFFYYCWFCVWLNFFCGHWVPWASCNYWFFVFVGMWFRLYNCHFSANRHFGFEAAAWYWYFIDGVWLFLFTDEVGSVEFQVSMYDLQL